MAAVAAEQNQRKSDSWTLEMCQTTACRLRQQKLATHMMFGRRASSRTSLDHHMNIFFSQVDSATPCLNQQACGGCCHLVLLVCLDVLFQSRFVQNGDWRNIQMLPFYVGIVLSTQGRLMRVMIAGHLQQTMFPLFHTVLCNPGLF